MSDCVGIDVHRKRSQVAVIDARGEVLANRNVPNGVEPILKVIGGLPPGTPAAFEAAFGTGWLAGDSSLSHRRSLDRDPAAAAVVPAAGARAIAALAVAPAVTAALSALRLVVALRPVEAAAALRAAPAALHRLRAAAGRRPPARHAEGTTGSPDVRDKLGADDRNRDPQR